MDFGVVVMMVDTQLELLAVSLISFGRVTSSVLCEGRNWNW